MSSSIKLLWNQVNPNFNELDVSGLKPGIHLLQIVQVDIRINVIKLSIL